MSDAVQFATEDSDLDLVPASEAGAEAQRLADDLGVAISLRNPLTDAVLETVHPSAQAAA